MMFEQTHLVLNVVYRDRATKFPIVVASYIVMTCWPVSHLPMLQLLNVVYLFSQIYVSTYV